MWHNTLGIIGFLLIPFFWFLFNVLGMRITMKEFFEEFKEHKDSGESWGIFD